MVPVNIYDKVVLEKQSKGITLTGSSNNEEIQWDNTNLAYKAAEIFFDKTKIRPGVKINIKKNIPAGGGLGGGSSNAASVIEGLNLLYGNILTKKEMILHSVTIGADVPFFLYHSNALIKGIGDIIKPANYKIPRWYIIWCPNVHCNTGEIYKEYDNLTKLPETNKIKIKKKVNFGENDLEKAVFKKYPDLFEKIKVFRNIKNINFYGLSGSGSCWYVNFKTKYDRDTNFIELNKVLDGNLIKTESICLGG